MIQRFLQKNIEEQLFKGKILIVYGARQVGKTTLVKEILKNYEGNYFNCDLLNVRRILEQQDPFEAKKFLGNAKIIVLDEAQRVQDIGIVLKQLIDTFPDIQIIATGSSSFDLSNKINEPLTGRAIEFKLYPLSVQELINYKDKQQIDEELERNLIFGQYPDIYLSPNDDAKTYIENIASQYLFKDILEFENLKKPRKLLNILELIALQIGNEVSINEIATKTGLNFNTVERYLDLLEKSFVIFRIRGFSRNLRKEITTKDKIYFFDLGIRNAIINQFNSLHLRQDIGGIWENFLIVERMKNSEYSGKTIKQYFWRTHDQKEIDYIEEKDEILKAYEFKWKKNKTSNPKKFLETYDNATFEIINRENYLDFLS